MDHEAIGFECVLPTESHARLIMQWRNDPDTLKMSFQTEPKKWETFYPEFLDASFSLSDLPPVFALVQGQRAAYLRFDLAANHSHPGRKRCRLSINVNPEMRRQGVGTRVLSAVQSWVRHQGYDEIVAEVKEENEASHKAFLASGFKEIARVQKEINDGAISVPIRCYLATLTPAKVSPVYVIAEAGSNWRVGTPAADKKMARTLIDIAVEAGADAVKFQIFRPETVYVANAGQSGYLSDAGIDKDISEIFASLAMPYDWIPELAQYCAERGIHFMASSFSPADFAAIDPYVRIHKIASYEISHPQLIALAAHSGKPLLLSTGASTEEDIAWAVQYFHQEGGRDLTLLQCTAKYPAPLESLNLKVIPWLKRRFHATVGLSDHSRDPVYAPLVAVALGATVIEKHFTLDNKLPGPDHAFALMPADLRAMIAAIRQVPALLGSGFKEVLEDEKELRAFAHRGIQATKAIGIGELFDEDKNIAILRPGNQPLGIHPKYLSDLEGKPAKRAIPLGAGIQFGDW